MDRITQSLLDEFSSENGLSKLTIDKQFEYFSSYLCIQRHFAETFDLTDAVLGKGGDTGIDGLAILVNGNLVTDAESVQDLAEANGYLEASFIFVQAETSSSFDTSKVGQFGFGVLDFFAENPSLQRNEKVSDAASIMTAVYKSSGKFKRGKPTCKLYYVTTGTWLGDANLNARKNAVIHDLEREQLFKDVEFAFVDADQLQKLYHQSKNAISREFTFSERTTIPEIPGVSEAYLGLIPALEFIKLLKDDNGEIIKSLFYDNVRDWQDYNAVNSEMKDTLESPDLRLRFALMNNGVTVIAKTLRPTGDRFYIEDYQIVNGCQTSHVLFNEQAYLDAKVMVPLRLISTQDEGVISSIVKATNRQTEVKAEQLMALSDFQKKLEKFFETFPAHQSLHYERRSRQFAGASFEKTRIVTPSNLIKAFAAIFLEEPHRTTRNYNALLVQVGKDIFSKDDRLEPYYMSAYALYQLEYMFRNQILESKYKAARFQILMVARIILSKAALPRMNSHDMIRFCEQSLKTWWDYSQAEKLLVKATKIIDNVSDGNLHRDHIRTQPFTEALKAAAKIQTYTP